MPVPYAYELRTRVMSAVANGMTIAEASRVYQVSRETIYKWKALQEATGDLRAAMNYQKGHSKIIQDDEAFKTFIGPYHDRTLKDLAALYPVPISSTTIARKLKQLGYSYKKKPTITPKEMSRHGKLLKKKQSHFPQKRLFILMNPVLKTMLASRTGGA
jgi:transposase